MPVLQLLLLCLLGLLAPTAKANLTTPAYRTQRVLYIGDSLSVGPFGREMQGFLSDQFTEKQIYMYASCGSSPEHWLSGEPSYVTKCGCRVKTPSKELHYEYERGRAPELYSTPKIESLLKESRPALVIVQLGTNWFDRVEQNGSDEELERLNGILQRFTEAIQKSPTKPVLVWITPPDSSRFRKVQGAVTKLLKTSSKINRFNLIDSSNMVRYTVGDTGSDGVHYYGPDALKWAEGVKRRLLRML